MDKVEDARSRVEFLRELSLLHQLQNSQYILKFEGFCVDEENSICMVYFEKCTENSTGMITQWCPQGSLNSIVFQPDYLPIKIKSACLLLHNVRVTTVYLLTK